MKLLSCVCVCVYARVHEYMYAHVNVPCGGGEQALCFKTIIEVFMLEKAESCYGSYVL